MAPVVRALLGGDPPLTLRFWDGSRLGPDRSPAVIVVHSPRALRRLLYSPNELGLARAYVTGELALEGDVFAMFQLVEAAQADNGDRRPLALGVPGIAAAWRAARKLQVWGPPLPPPPEEIRLRGRRHSKRRDRRAVSHHYDVSNDFYRLVLGETMTYSCAYFPTASTGLDNAQAAKYDLICRKLGLRAGMRLLDVGCGWGGMLLHAAQRYGVDAVGITVSAAQQQVAAKRIAEVGMTGRVELRLQDYREVVDGPYDAISSIGMFEHVGRARMGDYLGTLFGLLGPRGRLLNHAISRPDPSAGSSPRSFIHRYVFPDSELAEVGTVVSAMHGRGFEVRDVEALREHYAKTLRHWVTNLESRWEEAVGLVGAARARIWLLYLAGCCCDLEGGRLGLHQVLAVRPDADGASGMPATRGELSSGSP